MKSICIPVFIISQFIFAGILTVDHSLIQETSHHVEVTIENQVAVTKVTQTFFNHHSQSLEATYRFTLPDGAKIYQFSMWINGKEMQGAVVEKKRGRQIYEGIVNRKKDPALLEHVRGNTYSISIFPVIAKKQQRIELTYWQILPYSAGVIDYHYSLGDDSRKALTASEIQFSMDLTITAPVAIKVYSTSHKLKINKHKSIAKIAINPQFPFAKDFQLSYVLDRKKLAIDVICHREPNQHGYFMATITPPYEKPKNVNKAISFVLDSSGSMSGEKIDKSKESLRYLVNSLRKNDFFNIITFGSTVNSFAQKLIPATHDNKRRALQLLESITATGGTNLEGALQQTFIKNTKLPHIVVLLSDGYPTVGETNAKAIFKQVANKINENTYFFTFGVGENIDAHLLESLARENNGTYLLIKSQQNLEIEISRFFQKIIHPVLSKVQMKFNGANAQQVFPRSYTNLFHGSQLIVVGRYKTPGKFPVQLFGNDKLQLQNEITFVEKRLQSAFIKKLWASKRIDFALYQIRQNGEHKELVDEIIQLSKENGIITPYTSYLVLENDQQYKQYNLTPYKKKKFMQQGYSGTGSGGQKFSDTDSRRKAVTRIMPKKWTTRIEITKISKVFVQHYSPLLHSLQKKEEIKNWPNYPQSLEMTFNLLIRKINSFNGYLEYKNKEIKQKINDYTSKCENQKEQLYQLAHKIKKPNIEKQHKENLTREFRRIYNKFNINQRYKQGLTRNREDYQSLRTNLQILANACATLQSLYKDLDNAIQSRNHANATIYLELIEKATQMVNYFVTGYETSPFDFVYEIPEWQRQWREMFRGKLSQIK